MAPSPIPSAAPPADHPVAPWWALPAAMLGGLLGALQSRINSRLATDIDDGFTAAAISFGSGLVIVIVVVLASRPRRRATREFWGELRSGTFPWPLALGGLGGATFVLGQGLSVPLIGVALFIVCVVAGQTVTGLVVDRLGLGPGRTRGLSAPRVLGSALMVVSVVLAMSQDVGSGAPAILLALPVVAGVAVGMQQAVNGRVSAHTGAPMVATLTNFVVGTAVLVAAAILHALLVGHGPGHLPVNPVLYLGGAIGVGFIALAAHLAHPLGVLTLAMATIAGQIVGSVLLDIVAPVGGSGLTWPTLLGALLTLAAAAITAEAIPRRRRRPRAPGLTPPAR